MTLTDSGKVKLVLLQVPMVIFVMLVLFVDDNFCLVTLQRKREHIFSPGWGHSHWKGIWGCAAVMTPFFQASRRSLAHQFTVNAPLLCPPFSIFRKFLHFQPCFGQNLSSLDPKFSKFLFPRPHFFKENLLPRPYIFKPAWHTPTQKKVECPPPDILIPFCSIGAAISGIFYGGGGANTF